MASKICYKIKMSTEPNPTYADYPKSNVVMYYITNLDFMVSIPLLRWAGVCPELHSPVTHPLPPLKRGIYKIQRGHVLY